MIYGNWFFEKIDNDSIIGRSGRDVSSYLYSKLSGGMKYV